MPDASHKNASASSAAPSLQLSSLGRTKSTVTAVIGRGTPDASERLRDTDLALDVRVVHAKTASRLPITAMVEPETAALLATDPDPYELWGRSLRGHVVSLRTTLRQDYALAV